MDRTACWWSGVELLGSLLVKVERLKRTSEAVNKADQSTHGTSCLGMAQHVALLRYLIAGTCVTGTISE